MAQYSRIHHLAHLSVKQLRALDRANTVVIQPLGMIEVHGDHLPLGTDMIAVDALTAAAMSWLLDQNKTLRVLLLPTIPYGSDPVDQRRPELFTDAGSVWISEGTLKALVSDVVRHMVRYGFRYIFPLGFHGGGAHNIALGEVCDSLRTEFPDIAIFEPMGYVLGGAALDVSPGLETLLGRALTPQEQVALKGSVHASMFETSMMLALKPELVGRGYKNLGSLGWDVVYKGDDWPGYVGAGPRHADAAVGKAVLQWRGVRAASLMVRAMQGEDLSDLPRHPVWEADEIIETEQKPRPPAAAGPAVEFLDKEELRKLRKAAEEQNALPDHLRDTMPGNMFDTDTIDPDSDEV